MTNQTTVHMAGRTPAAVPYDDGEMWPRPWMWDALAVIRSTARQHHYAVAVHGSMARDVDLVVVPWAEVPSPVHELITGLKCALGVHAIWSEPESKHHGRVAWSISFPGRTPDIDLSVMPPTQDTENFG